MTTIVEVGEHSIGCNGAPCDCSTFYASCACNWEGPTRTTLAEAEADKDLHEARTGAVDEFAFLGLSGFTEGEE